MCVKFIHHVWNQKHQHGLLIRIILSRKEEKHTPPSCFIWLCLRFVACAVATHTHTHFDVAVSKSNPEACVPDPYWTNLRQWSQQLRTLMIWTHWGLLLRAHRLAARSPINSFLLKLFARQHKSILFCLGQGRPCEICRTYLYIFFQMNAENDWLICMRKKKQRSSALALLEYPFQHWFS